MPSFSRYFIFMSLLACFLINHQTIFSQENKSGKQLRNELNRAFNDSSKVRILFELGDQFIDGPTDSLMYYYEQALVVINANLKRINADNQPNNQKEYVQFKEFELRVYIEFGIEYFFRSDYPKALENFNRALEIAIELGNQEVISECYSEIAIVYENQGKYDQAIVYNEKAIHLAKEDNNPSWLAACYANHGTIYLKKGYYTLALDYYFKALKTFEQLEHSRRISSCYLNIGKIYTEQQDFTKALDYYRRTLKISIETGDKVNQSECYLGMGKVYLNNGDYNLARDYLNQSVAIFKEMGYSHQLDECYKNIGQTYLAENNLQKARENFQMALEISTKEEDLPGIAEAYIKLAQIKFIDQDIKSATELANQSLEIANRSGNLKSIRDANQLLANLYENQGDEKSALIHFKQYAVIKDSLLNESKYKTIREIEARFETEKKEQQLDLLTEKNEVQQLKLSRRRNLLIVSAVGILMILIISYLLIRQNRIKAKHKSIELEQRLLRSQMNPHFIFNSLIAIQSFIYKKEPVLAGDYLARFAELVRLTLENSRVEFVLLETEIKTLEAYLELQVLRFENKFDYTLKLDDNINTESLLVPPMFAQPFIENAIEHGLRHKQEKGFLNIQYSIKSNRCIEVTISDNGIGREKARDIEKKKQHQSLAINITKERLSILQNKYKYKFFMEVIDLKDAKGHATGTKIKIAIPYKLV